MWYSDVPHVTAHPSTASVPITVLLYDGPLLCGFNVAIKGLNAADTKSGIESVIKNIVGRVDNAVVG